jgi:hypothetical protein
MMEYPPGWTCERTVLQFELYWVRQLRLEDSLALAEHLEACPECYQQLVLYRMEYRRSRRA